MDLFEDLDQSGSITSHSSSVTSSLAIPLPYPVLLDALRLTLRRIVDMKGAESPF